MNTTEKLSCRSALQPDLFGTAAAGAIDFSLPAISIRQPWAHAIVAGLKDVENRTWRTKYRGPVLIHAGKTKDTSELWSYIDLKSRRGIEAKTGAEWRAMVFGGIIGVAEIVDCVSQMDSPWFTGPWGFVLRNARPLPFYPCRGRLGFFKAEGGRAE